jgi:multidrug efflux system membrane fusion protein
VSSSGRLKRLLAIAAIGAGCLSAAAYGVNKQREDSAGAAQAPARNGPRGSGARAAGEAPPVTVAKAELADVPIELNAFGTVEASSTVDVVPQVTGLITDVAFKEGAFVKKGDLLFSVDTRPYRASLAQAQATLAKSHAQAEQAKSESLRYAELERQGLATDQQRTQAEADAAAARAQVQEVQAQIQSASLNVNFTRITAPIDGKTGSLLVHAGNVIQANAPNPLVVIRALSPVQVRFAVPQTYVDTIRNGLSMGDLTVRATPRGEGAQTAVGQLTFMENTVDAATGTLSVKATFANAGLELWPGAAVDAVLVLGSDRQATVVPEAAVRQAQSGKYVFVVGADGVASQRAVEVLRTTPRLALIESGVQAGEQVVTDGQVRLRDGIKVAVQSPPAAEATPQRRDGAARAARTEVAP